jgi:hypothetical protein
MRRDASGGAQPHQTPIFRFSMMIRFLTSLLVLLVVLAVGAKVREATRPHARDAVAAAADSARHDLTLGAHAGTRPVGANDFMGVPPRPLDSLERAGARIRLGAEVQRHYLDSLFAGPDSIVRHWAVDGGAIMIAIVPGGSEGFLPEMTSEVRTAFDLWSPAAAGLRFLEQDDTVGADMTIRWADTLEADRAGATDVTWDKGGRIHRVTVYLRTRSPTTGQPFGAEARRAIALHELGHALGLPHSTHPEDVMYPVATATALTDRDRFSLRLLYELPTGWIGTSIRAVSP